MATHSNVLAWRTPGTGEPGGLYKHHPHCKPSDFEFSSEEDYYRISSINPLSPMQSHGVFWLLMTVGTSYAIYLT